MSQTFGVVIAAAMINTWWGWLASWFWLGRGHVLLSALQHEAAHRLLFPHRRMNDIAGRWLASYPSFQMFSIYRRAHLAHHADTLGRRDPFVTLFQAHPMSPAAWRRTQAQEALGKNALQSFLGLARAARDGRREAIEIVTVQALMLGLSMVVDRPWAYVVWLSSWATLARLSSRIRAVVEHGGLKTSRDIRESTHVVRQTWIGRLILVPYNIGWHLAHHIDPKVPFHNLPRFHDTLINDRVVPASCIYRSYRALLRAVATS